MMGALTAVIGGSSYTAYTPELRAPEVGRDNIRERSLANAIHR